MNTRWKIILGFNGLYRLSDTGIVQSCHKKGSRSGERGEWWNMSLPKDRAGYDLVYLWDKRNKPSRVRRLVHQLVAEMFVPGWFDGACVNHINGDKSDNRHTNLEWCSLGDNIRHAWRTGLCKPPKLTPAEVLNIHRHPANDTETAKVFGVSQVMVTRIRAGKAWEKYHPSIQMRAAEHGIYIPDPNEQLEAA